MHCKSVSDIDREASFSDPLCSDNTVVWNMSYSSRVVPKNSEKYLGLHFWKFKVVTLQQEYDYCNILEISNCIREVLG